MFKGRFNSSKKPLAPSPAEMETFCKNATDAGGKGLQEFIAKFGKGALDSRCPATGYTALIRAAQYGHLANCTLLLGNGADVNATDKDGWSALMAAVNHSRRDSAVFLLDNKADINAQNLTGATPLMTAARVGDEGLAQLLLQRGADPLIPDITKRNAGAVARDYARTMGDAAHERVAAMIEQAVAAAEMAAANQAIGQLAQGLTGGLDKPMNVSRPISYKI